MSREAAARAALIVLAALVFCSFLGVRDLWAPDEPKYALAAKEMLETGQLLIPHVNGEPYPDKPPLMFWLIAAASLPAGRVSPTAAVLPSILAALVALAGTMHLVRAVCPDTGPRAELLAAGLLATSYRFVMQATCGQLDMLLAAFTTWALVLLFVTLGGPAPRRGRLTGAWLLMGLGTLAKGPVALVIPLGGVAAAAVATGRARALRRLVSPSGLLAFAAVVGAWLVPAAIHATRSGQTAWLTDLLFRQTLVRYAASWHHHQPWWFFLVVPWHDLFPASALLPAPLLALLRRDGTARDADTRRRQAMVALAAAAGFGVLFFSIPSGKRGLYLLPLYPLLAALIALDIERRIASGRRLGALRAGLAAAGLVLVALGALIPAVVRGVLVEQAPAWLEAHGIALSVGPLAAALALAGLASLAAAALPHAWPRALVAPGLAMAVVYVALARTVYPAIDASRSPARLVEEIRARVVPESRAAMVDFRAQFGFYAGRMIDARTDDEQALDDIAAGLAGDDPFWVLLRREHLPLVQRRLPPGARPVVVLERAVGDDEMIVLASPRTLRDHPRALP